MLFISIDRLGVSLALCVSKASIGVVKSLVFMLKREGYSISSFYPIRTS